MKKLITMLLLLSSVIAIAQIKPFKSEYIRTDVFATIKSDTLFWHQKGHPFIDLDVIVRSKPRSILYKGKLIKFNVVVDDHSFFWSEQNKRDPGRRIMK